MWPLINPPTSHRPAPSIIDHRLFVQPSVRLQRQAGITHSHDKGAAEQRFLPASRHQTIAARCSVPYAHPLFNQKIVLVLTDSTVLISSYPTQACFRECLYYEDIKLKDRTELDFNSEPVWPSGKALGW